MNFVSIEMICKHTGRHRVTVLRAIRKSQTKAEKFDGVKGFRVTLRDANKLINRNWPEVGSMGTGGVN